MHRRAREAKADLRDAKLKLSRNLDSQEWRWRVSTIGLVVAGYFASSLVLTFFQKNLISIWSSCSAAGKDRIVLTWGNYLSRVAFVAFFSALDIGLSQWSLEYVTISLYTMTKTTSVLFILMFALIFKLERKHWSLILIVLMISVGLFLFVLKSTTFNLVGFIMALSAAFLSGARWTLSQLVMQKSKLGLQNPIDLIYHIQPLMVLTLLPFAVGFEGMSFAASEHAFRYRDYEVVLTTAGLIGLGGSIAFVMEVFEFFIVTKASSLTLSIVGIIKEIATILLDVFFNGSELSPVNVVGVVVCLSGIAIHIARKATNPDEPMTESRSIRRGGGGGGGGGGGDYRELNLPLLSENDSELSSDEDLFNFPLTGGSGGGGADGGKKYRDYDDDFFLKDNREWTSVRDSQLKMNRDEDGLDDDPDVPQVLLKDGKGAGSRQKKKEPLLADIQLQSD